MDQSNELNHLSNSNGQNSPLDMSLLKCIFYSLLSFAVYIISESVATFWRKTSLLFLYRLSNIDAKIHGSISFIPCNKASKNILRIKNDLNFCKAKKHLWKNLNISFMLFSQFYYKFNKQHQKINISATPYVYCLVSTDIKKPTWKNRITGTVHVRLKCNNLLLRYGKQFSHWKNWTIPLS